MDNAMFIPWVPAVIESFGVMVTDNPNHMLRFTQDDFPSLALLLGPAGDDYTATVFYLSIAMAEMTAGAGAMTMDPNTNAYTDYKYEFFNHTELTTRMIAIDFLTRLGILSDEIADRYLENARASQDLLHFPGPLEFAGYDNRATAFLMQYVADSVYVAVAGLDGIELPVHPDDVFRRSMRRRRNRTEVTLDGPSVREWTQMQESWVGNSARVAETFRNLSRSAVPANPSINFSEVNTVTYPVPEPDEPEVPEEVEEPEYVPDDDYYPDDDPY